MDKVSLLIDWTLFRAGDDVVGVPRTPLLVRLRRVVGDEFYSQAALDPLRRLMEAAFFIGPGGILLALYFPRLSLAFVAVGLLCLTLASLYWFAPHWLCRHYLRYRGYTESKQVQGATIEDALAKAT